MCIFPGHYISVDTSQGTPGETAVLLSPELYSEEWSCIRLIYQIASSSVLPVHLTALNLYLRVAGESFDHLLWTTTERSESWLIASLDVRNSTNKYKVSLTLRYMALTPVDSIPFPSRTYHSIAPWLYVHLGNCIYGTHPGRLCTRMPP